MEGIKKFKIAFLARKDKCMYHAGTVEDYYPTASALSPNSAIIITQEQSTVSTETWYGII